MKNSTLLFPIGNERSLVRWLLKFQLRIVENQNRSISARGEHPLRLLSQRRLLLLSLIISILTLKRNHETISGRMTVFKPCCTSSRPSQMSESASLQLDNHSDQDFLRERIE